MPNSASKGFALPWKSTWHSHIDCGVSFESYWWARFHGSANLRWLSLAFTIDWGVKLMIDDRDQVFDKPNLLEIWSLQSPGNYSLSKKNWVSSHTCLWFLQLVLDRPAISTATTISCILPVQMLLQLVVEQHPSQGPGETQMEWITGECNQIPCKYQNSFFLNIANLSNMAWFVGTWQGDF